jgi:hypothetical protein
MAGILSLANARFADRQGVVAEIAGHRLMTVKILPTHSGYGPPRARLRRPMFILIPRPSNCNSVRLHADIAPALILVQSEAKPPMKVKPISGGPLSIWFFC